MNSSKISFVTAFLRCHARFNAYVNPNQLEPTYLLERRNKLLQCLNTLGLELAGKQSPGLILLAQLLVLLIVLHEEPKILIRNVHIWVSTQSSMLLHSFLTATERIPIDLILDLIRGIRHINRRIRIRRTHLGRCALKCGKELGMQERGFRVSKLRGNIASQTEIRVLVDRTGDKGGDVFGCTENVRMRVGE